MKEIIIQSKTSFRSSLKEIWDYRELFYFLAWRDVKVRYKQTVIGVAWALLQPFITMVVFSVFFGRVAGIQTSGIPYALFTFVGLLFWNYFSNSLSSASDSMISNRGIIQKVYFPRIILPLSSTLVFLLDFICALILFFVLALFFQQKIYIWGILFIIPALIISFLCASGFGLVAASLNVKYRDIRYALPFFIQTLIFVSPVIYPVSVLGKYQWLWFLNPMSGVIETARNLLFMTSPVNWGLFFSSAIVSLLIFLAGIWYFSKTEKWFADIV
ncbi:TPA: phosphate ABC transporter permease [Patescibacteria group bacterium]|nr:MAG: ABC-2 type transporter [Candidatus Woesebacteria bacterium GW2011_GWC1_42_9]HCI05316.1 phosphate ABC transporter permease [Patescibacteria group bacterium]